MKLDNSKIVATVSKLEEKADNHEKRIDSLESSNKDIARLAAVMEEQIKVQSETNLKQEEKMDQQHSTLVKVNENLTGLTNGLTEVNNRVGVLEETKKDTKKKAVDFVLKIIGGLVLAYLLYKTGM